LEVDVEGLPRGGLILPATPHRVEEGDRSGRQVGCDSELGDCGALLARAAERLAAVFDEGDAEDAPNVADGRNHRGTASGGGGLQWLSVELEAAVAGRRRALGCWARLAWRRRAEMALRGAWGCWTALRHDRRCEPTWRHSVFARCVCARVPTAGWAGRRVS
jgi:hypothetical protein